MRPAETRDKLQRWSKRHRRSSFLLRNVVPGDVRGAWHRLAV